ncbi:uncharacterized protein UV8b_05510 [Ustilaginoidea virens]|uniref:Transcription factor spt8 beta-propeller domain-containing protein n=1 Tax=Ustilaginoidea virens TaxID=1159556 RepID=A0A1B5L1I5_USTVR|nr:uncharacterized protein UV8b_05510 [Ustilaginoidea virens]QUC21267.1 hypothetical protein UV8b_05510 [Ustilaginoidea virens]GAO17244.1 hypothetical protein UVI_02057220 [Ustilaginoidea virens]
MDDEDHFSASSPESERAAEPDEMMDDAEDGDNDMEQDEDNNDDDDENNENDNDDEGHGDGHDDGHDDAHHDAHHETQKTDEVGPGSQSLKPSSPARPGTTTISKLHLRPSIRPEAITARLYDIVPTMAAPQSTSINAMAITPDLRYWITGGSDGYIRKYDGPGTINGKLALTVAQRHPFVDSVTKAGILMSYWENEEPAAPGKGEQDHILSPVYSLAVHSEALWLLSGLESGGINLQSVRHDEGKKIACLQQHSNAVSSLTLAPDEKSVLSGGWDKNIFDWDLNTGQTIRSFDGSGGQISSIELRPASGDPVPAEADEPIRSTTLSTNSGAPTANAVLGVGGESGGGPGLGLGLGRGGAGAGSGEGPGPGAGAGADADADADADAGSGAAEGLAGSSRDGEASPAHESLFGGSDAGSLFGETAGEQPFGHDDDGFGASMGMMPGSHEGPMDYSADFAMADAGKGGDSTENATSAPNTQPPPPQQEQQQQEQQQQEQQQQQQQEEALVPQEPLPDAMDIDGKAAAAQVLAANEAATSPTTQDAQTAHGQSPRGEDDKKTTAQTDQAEQSPEQWHSPSASTFAQAPPQQHEQSQTSATTFLSSAIDGTIRIWDRRAPRAVARIGTRPGVPPWCMSACWSPDGNMIYTGRRNGTVEEFDVRRAKRGWAPERTLKFPAGSGAVSAVRSMPNGRHLVCASHDILRLYDLSDTRAFKHSTVPFLIIPGPPRAGVISSLYIDPTCRFMLSAAGTRGWEGSSTEVLIGYEINVVGE